MVQNNAAAPALLDPRAYVKRTAGFVQSADEIERRRAIHLFVQDRATKLGRFVDEPYIGANGVPTTVKVYRMYDDCIGCLRDLKKIWNIDVSDDARPVAHAFHKIGLITSDLLPLILSNAGAGPLGDKIALQATQLIIGMTWPIDIAEELREAKELKDAEDEPEMPIDYHGLKRIQLEYKAIILQKPEIFSKVFALALPALRKRRVDRTEKDLRIISLVMFFYRNLLAIADPRPSEPSIAAVNDIVRSSLQSDLILVLHQARILEFLVQAASHAEGEFNMYNTLILEILYLIFVKVDKEELMLVRTTQDKALQSKHKKSNKENHETLSSQARSTNYLNGTTADSGSLVRQKRLEDMLAREASERSLQSKDTGSRHSRFGTTIQIRTRERRTSAALGLEEEAEIEPQRTFNLHKQGAIKLEPSQLINQRKKGKWLRPKLNDENTPQSYPSQTLIVIREIALHLLEYGFNSLVASIRKDIEYAREKVKEADQTRFTSFIAAMLFILRNIRMQESDWGVDHAVPIVEESEQEEEIYEGHDYSLIAVATEKKTFALILRRMITGLEDRQWKDLASSCACFSELLLLMEAMSQSGREEFVETAETCLLILFHEQAHFDCFVNIVKAYTIQPSSFLEIVLSMTYHILRILDKFTKTKTVYVRKKKSDRKTKPKSLPNDEEEKPIEDISSEAAAQDTHIRKEVQYREQALKLSTLERAYADEKVVDVCMSFLQGYREFQSSYKMKMLVGLMHRIAIKVGAVRLFHKLSYYELISAVCHDLALLPQSQSNKDLGQLLFYIIKSFLKKVNDDSWVIVELLFPPHRSDVRKEFNHNSDSEEEAAKTALKLPRVPAELTIKPGFSWNEQVRIAVSVLIENEKMWSVTWIKEVLILVCAERTDIALREEKETSPEVDLHAALTTEEIARIRAGHEKAKHNFSDFSIKLEDERQTHGSRYDSELKLLMTLIGFVKSSTEKCEAHDLQWLVPASLAPSDLSMRIQLIDNAIRDPLSEQGKKTSDLLKKVTKPRVSTKRRRDSGDDNLSEEEGIEARKRSAKERVEYKSAQIIEDSDDDLEADAIFFAKEQALAMQLSQIANATKTVQTSFQPAASSQNSTLMSDPIPSTTSSPSASDLLMRPRKQPKARPRAETDLVRTNGSSVGDRDEPSDDLLDADDNRETSTKAPSRRQYRTMFDSDSE